MSAISSVGSSSASLYMQQMQAQRAQSGGDCDDGQSSVGGVQGTSGSTGTGAARFQSKFEAAAKAVGVDSSKVADLEKQVQDAVQQAKQGGTSSRSSIRDAINTVLQNNGIDPAKFESAMKTQGGQGAQAAGTHRHHHGGHHKAQAADATQSADATSSIAPKDVQPGQTTGTLVDVAA